MSKWLTAGIGIALWCAAAVQVAGDERELRRLIDDLVNTAEPGFGYSVAFSGSEFLPYAGTGEMSTFVFGASRAARSETLQKIVEQGADAVPTLLKHLGDRRKTKMAPTSGMMWMNYADEFDFNRRTAAKIPQGVNRDEPFSGDKDLPDEHVLTVGDLCFVALGQIVNRNYNAMRYQPTGGLVVNSPTASEALRKAVETEWRDFSREKHRAGLIADFREADHEDRRIGAYRRLAYYYPDTFEALVVEELTQPMVDIFVVENFCRETLYKTKAVDERRSKFTAFVREHGEHYAPAVMDYLFQDLDTLEADEQGRLRPRLTRFGAEPRELLIQLFDRPKDVKAADRPLLTIADETERARLIEALVHERSQRVGDAVRELYLQSADDDYFAPACLRSLAARGYADFLVEQLNKIDVQTTATNYRDLQCVEAIATSSEPKVRGKLLDICNSTTNDAYFMAALPAIDAAKHEAIILRQAQAILDGLPVHTTQGEDLLSMIGEKFPDKAAAIYRKFLEVDSPQRGETMCRVLWYGHPLSIAILAPLLDDRRPLEGFTVPLRVCDRAAQAISHTSKELEFDSDWNQKARDAAIIALKNYCARQGK